MASVEQFIIVWYVPVGLPLRATTGVGVSGENQNVSLTKTRSKQPTYDRSETASPSTDARPVRDLPAIIKNLYWRWVRTTRMPSILFTPRTVTGLKTVGASQMKPHHLIITW